MSTPFIILSTQRSGSTVLIRSLDTHPEIFCAGEMFNVAKGMHHKEWFFGRWGISSKNNFIKKLNKIINYPNLKYNSPKHLDDFFSANEKGEKLRGFKLMRNQIKENPAIISYLEKHKVKVILLIRKNIFTNALSRFKMKETGVAHAAESGKKNALWSTRRPYWIG
jgi:LPS sulfotransferase NodH